MKCKNCEHGITETKEGWKHMFGYKKCPNLVFSVSFGSNKTNQSCHCINPEPTSDLGGTIHE